MEAEKITKQGPYICCLQETHFSLKRCTEWKQRDGKRYFLNMEKNKGKAAVPHKIDFKTKAITRGQEGPSNSTSGYLFKETQNTNSKIYMCPYVYCSVVYNN